MQKRIIRYLGASLLAVSALIGASLSQASQSVDAGSITYKGSIGNETNRASITFTAPKGDPVTDQKASVTVTGRGRSEVAPYALDGR